MKKAVKNRMRKLIARRRFGVHGFRTPCGPGVGRQRNLANLGIFSTYDCGNADIDMEISVSTYPREMTNFPFN